MGCKLHSKLNSEIEFIDLGLTILSVDDRDHANDEKNERIESVIHWKILSNEIHKIILAFIPLMEMCHDDMGKKKTKD